MHDWSRMFQKDEVPEDLPLITVPFAEVAAPHASTTDDDVQVKLDKLLAKTGLAGTFPSPTACAR